MKTKFNYTNWKSITLAVIACLLMNGVALGGGPSPTPTAIPSPSPAPATVSLPIDTLDTTVPGGNVLLKPVITTDLDASLNYIGFQGDFTFNETICTFAGPTFVASAGLTSSNWNVSGNILPGAGPIRTLRVSAFSNDLTPLSGAGTLYNLRMLRTGGTPASNTALTWSAAPRRFVFIDVDLVSHPPTQVNGLITITGPPATPSPTPTATSTVPPSPSPSATSTATATATATSSATSTATATATATATVTPTATATATAGGSPCGGTVLNENFDSVTAPALPAGWVASNAAGAAPLWVTSTTTPDTAPNTAFIDDPAVVSDKRLDTPAVAISSAAAQVTFRNFYFLESTFDGGVLEVSSPNINGGTFTDITNAAVGGNFVSGGYNATISTAFQSPIAGRMAWSGNAGGYLNTVANLGPNVNGQTIKLRFRMASDNSVSATGWRVDTVRVVNGACPSVTPTATATSTGTPAPTATATSTATGSPTCAPLSQGFDDILALPGLGWVQTNHSTVVGTTNWFQGNSTVFPGQSGGGTSYIGANFNNTTATNTISNWLLTSPVTLQNGATMSFYTRTVDAPSFPDRLQVRMSTAGASSNVGTTATDVGDFTTLLLDINPTYTTTGYPNVWTQFTVNVTGVASPTLGRLAFRYFVESGGPTGANSDYIGIDTFAFNGACGPTPTATATSTGTPSSTPTATATATGSPCAGTVLSENFDSVTAPALPAGWVASNAAGAAPLWVTSTTTPDTAPNAAFIDDPAVVTDKRLDTPALTISAAAQVSFRNFYFLESTFDGGVLEVSSPNINGGTFTDITNAAVGGSFTTGGYNATISTAFQSPIAGRMAWSGNAGGYINSVANLGPNVVGQTIKLRFRMASDNSVSATGWRVDTILVSGGSCGTPSPTPTATATSTGTPAPSATPSCPPIITQSSSQTITPGSVSCNNGTGHTDNSYWRAFNMQTAVGGAAYNVTSVSFGVESANVTQPVTVRLYTNSGAAFPGGTRTQIATSTINVTAAQTGTVVTAPLVVTVPAGTSELVMELFTPDGQAAGNLFFVGSNASPESGPSYLSATACGVTSPTTTAALGFPNMHIVFNVQGSCGEGTPSPTPTATATSTGSPSATASPSCAPLTQGFEDILALPALGWVQTNHSTAVGTTNWFQGNDTVFPAQSGTTTSYIGANFNNTTGTNTISNWLLTSPVTLQNGSTMTFYTRTVDAPSFPDRLQVRMSTAGASSNVGTTATDVGDFTTLLLDINPTYTTDGYPNVWTQFTATVTGVATPTLGRLAFRYFVENGGPTGANSDYIGIDTFVFNGACASPTPGTPTPTATSTVGASVTPTATATATAGGGTPTPTATITPTPSASPVAAQPLNLSTRMRVLTDANVGIGGFIVTGTGQKTVLLRAIGPSLGAFGVPDPLADPVMELHGPSGFTTITNDNWKDTQQAEIKATGLAPTNDLESAILVTLDPGNYTAIVKGKNNGVGVGLVEAYDLDFAAAAPLGSSSKLGNISTRAFVGTGTDIMIAGFILGGNTADDNMILRGIGPSLTQFGVPDALADPTLELRNNDGALLRSNDNWQDDPAQAAIISAAGLAPTNALESAMAATLPPGTYTALLAGKNNGTGVGLVEAYDLGGGGAPIPTPTPGNSPTATATATAGGPSPTATAGGTPNPSPTAGVTPTPSGPCVENWDSVTAPALPAGWTATNPDPGDGTMWVTSIGTPDSAPNCAFVPDQDGISDKVLDRMSVTITGASAMMTFRNNFDTEFSDGIFWDGYVLEVSAPNISAGDFLDITDSHVGGSFVSGGYTGEIDGTADNPLAGRMAWSSSSGGYIDTVINMGPNLGGQTVTLRFRMGTDEAVAAPGVRIDNISITNASCP